MQQTSPTAALTAPLPVLDILNNVITITNYLSAVNSAALPAWITSNPDYGALPTEYGNWQYTLWAQYFQGLVNANILAQAQVINNLLGQGITQQSVFKSVITPGSAATPSVILSCDAVGSQISAGQSYAQQLQIIANQIRNADQEKIKELNAIIAKLNKQFGDMEQQLTDKALDNTKQVVVTVVNVGVAVASEKDPISPLVEGVAKLGTDIIKEIVLTSEINDTVAQLEDAWDELDQATIQLAQVNMIINRLNKIVNNTSKAVNALNNIVNDWQLIYDTVNASPGEWASTGLKQLTQWGDRITRVSFYSNISQTVN